MAPWRVWPSVARTSSATPLSAGVQEVTSVRWVYSRSTSAKMGVQSAANSRRTPPNWWDSGWVMAGV